MNKLKTFKIKFSLNNKPFKKHLKYYFLILYIYKMTEKINFNSSDDLENIHILEKKLIERVKRICNIDKNVYIEIKLKLVELAEKLTTENKLKFLLFLDDTGLNLEDVAELMSVLFTHCITHLFIKNLINELIEIRDDISQNEDIMKIYDELHFFSCSTYLNFNEPPPPTIPPPPKTTPKRKPKPKQPEPQTETETEPQTETETEPQPEQQKTPFKPKRKPRTKQPQTEQAKEYKKQDKEQKKELYKKLELIFN